MTTFEKIQVGINLLFGVSILLLCAQVGLLHKRLSNVYMALSAISGFTDAQRKVNESFLKWMEAQSKINHGGIALAEQIRREVVKAANVVELPKRD